MEERLNAKELANATGITEEEASQCIYQYDEDGDGTLSRDDFDDLKVQILAQQRENITNKLNASDFHDAIDADGDGKLSASELATACNITEQEAQKIIHQYDEDGDGMLNEQEFHDLKQQILSQQRDNMTDKLSHNQGHTDIDINNDGKLSAQELAVACNITQLEAKNIILQYDQDGDGMLDADEFEDLKQQILSQQRDKMTDKISANDTFQNMDANSDKKLTAKELADACGISELQAKNIIEQYDVDNDGTLNAEEFEDLKQKTLEQQRDKISSDINEFSNVGSMDDNKDGKLDANELANACDISVSEAELLIEQYDTNNDGMLNEQEFENLKQKILSEKKEKERLEKIKADRAERQRQQQKQYTENNIDGKDDDDNNNNNNNNDNDSGVQEFKHKWKFGMNFDPKNESVVIYISDEITNKNWGITLGKNDFNGPIRQEYRKLGGVISNGTIKYDYPQNNGSLGVHITGKNNENYNYQCPEQL